ALPILHGDSASTSSFDDPRVPLQRALRLGSIALAIITVLSLAIWGGVRGLPGIWGVIIGAAIGGGFVLITPALVLFNAKSAPSITMSVVLCGWLLDVERYNGVMMIIRDLEFYDTMSMFITVVLAMIAVLGTEVWGIITSRVTYIS